MSDIEKSMQEVKISIKWLKNKMSVEKGQRQQNS